MIHGVESWIGHTDLQFVVAPEGGRSLGSKEGPAITALSASATMRNDLRMGEVKLTVG